MHDWQRIVEQQLRLRGLPQAQSTDINRELAAHLEETYDSITSCGASRAEAREATLQEVDDWRVLAKNIRRAQSQEDFVNHRTKSLWLPALVTFLGASVALMACQLFGLQPRLIWVAKMGMTFYWPWLFTLPFFGAAGAYLSQRARGTILARLAASLSPALVMLTIMLLVLLCGFCIDRIDVVRLTSVAFGLGLINWVVIPALALLLGAAPFLRGERTPLAHQA